MSLNDTYGSPTEPLGEKDNEYSNIEKHKKPESLQTLDKITAHKLKQYIDSINQGLLFPQLIHRNCVILWLMDERGDIHFCIEEMYKASATNIVIPRIDGVKYPDGYEKLGHPSLIEAAKARIAGEIIWDPDFDEASNWIINNKSGRYGIRKEITITQLQNVIKLFNTFEINLVPDLFTD